jgi:hypothetical protein
MPAPRVAGKKTFKCQPSAFKRAIFLYCLQPISAARGCETAFCSKEWRYSSLVEADETNKYGREHFAHYYLEFGIWNLELNVSIPFTTASLTTSNAGIAASVKIRNKCSCCPSGTLGYKVCLLSRQASTICLRIRWRSTDPENFFLGTEKPVSTGDRLLPARGTSL